MGKKKQTTQSETKSIISTFYGTKKEWFKADLNMKMNEIFDDSIALNEQAVVAEDEIGLYVTGKSFVGGSTLDPYRLYNRIVPTVVTDENNNVSYKVNR